MKKAMLFILIIISALTGCRTLAKFNSEKKIIYGLKANSSITELSLIENIKGGKKTAVLKSPLLGWAELKGAILTDQTGDMIFEINSISYLGNWANGWTKGEHDAYGRIILKKNGDKYKCSVADKIEIFEIRSGSIKYNEDYYLNGEGSKKVKDRIDRIMELVRFLKTKDFKKIYYSPKYKTGYGNSFKIDTQSFLFPETLDFKKLEKKNMLPEAYYKTVKEEDNKENEVKDEEKNINKFQFGFGYFWNREYTAKIFPPNLRELRNSGSLWRDYEEALHIVYSFYNLEYYCDEILNNSEFIIKK